MEKRARDYRVFTTGCARLYHNRGYKKWWNSKDVIYEGYFLWHHISPIHVGCRFIIGKKYKETRVFTWCENLAGLSINNWELEGENINHSLPCAQLFYAEFGTAKHQDKELPWGTYVCEARFTQDLYSLKKNLKSVMVTIRVFLPNLYAHLLYLNYNNDAQQKLEDIWYLIHSAA